MLSQQKIAAGAARMNPKIDGDLIIGKKYYISIGYTIYIALCVSKTDNGGVFKTSFFSVLDKYLLRSNDEIHGIVK